MNDARSWHDECYEVGVCLSESDMPRFVFAGLVVLLTLVGCGAEPSSEFTEETLAGHPDGKADNANAISFGDFDYYVPPAKVLRAPTSRMITTASAFQRFFGEEPPSFFDFDREWMVFVTAGAQSESGVTIRVDGVQLTSTGKSLRVLTTTSQAGAACTTTQASYAPFKLVSFARPRVSPSAVRYYGAAGETTCAASACEADARSLLAAASEGINHMSESDYPFDPMLVPGGAAATTDEDIARLLGEPDGEELSTRDFAGWFEYRAEVNDPDDAPHVREVEGYRRIKQLYESRFSNLRVLRVGEIEVHVYLIGETDCGDLAVLKTVSIET